MRTITLEEHVATPAFMEGPGRQLRAMADSIRDHPEAAAGVGKLVERLLDVGDGRLAEMDAAAIDVQVLSLTSPGTEQLPAVEATALARSVNDALAGAVAAHPDRFAAFAALPTADPTGAAGELTRAVRELGFPGAQINGHTGGRYLDDEFFWPILERTEQLSVPIYLHPTPPPGPVAAAYAGNYSPGVAGVFATSAWGWHIETAFHVIRLILGGALDRFPRLQFVVGHLGEVLPFMLPRLELALPSQLTKLARPFSAYLRENLHYTVSGFNWTPAFLDLFLEVGVDRIMFSADHPYQSMAEARDFLDHLPVSLGDRERIAHGNAERLLGL
ncbi:MAG: amidohydrolase family protein [Candidatus Dormiibacterota bacterium]